jgi:transposase InsO family protein
MQNIHFNRHTRCYGSPRMTRELRAAGRDCSENRVARMMRLNGLRARPRRPFRPKTTQPDHAAYPSPNLLSQAGPASVPGAQLVSDITYIPTSEGWLYLAIVIDLFSRAILGWKLSDTLHADRSTAPTSTKRRKAESQDRSDPRSRDRAGKLRVIVRTRNGEDFVHLAFSEIRFLRGGEHVDRAPKPVPMQSKRSPYPPFGEGRHSCRPSPRRAKLNS